MINKVKNIKNFQEKKLADLAVIAGNGNFPFLFLNEMKGKNEEVIVIALIGETDKKIEDLGLKVFWANIGKLNKIISIMHENNVKKAIMCGQVVHTKLFTEVQLDFRAIKMLSSLANKKNRQPSWRSGFGDGIRRHHAYLVNYLYGKMASDRKRQFNQD